MKLRSSSPAPTSSTTASAISTNRVSREVTEGRRGKEEPDFSIRYLRPLRLLRPSVRSVSSVRLDPFRTRRAQAGPVALVNRNAVDDFGGNRRRGAPAGGVPRGHPAL